MALYKAFLPPNHLRSFPVPDLGNGEVEPASQGWREPVFHSRIISENLASAWDPTWEERSCQPPAPRVACGAWMPKNLAGAGGRAWLRGASSTQEAAQSPVALSPCSNHRQRGNTPRQSSQHIGSGMEDDAICLVCREEVGWRRRVSSVLLLWAGCVGFGWWPWHVCTPPQIVTSAYVSSDSEQGFLCLFRN